MSSNLRTVSKAVRVCYLISPTHSSDLDSIATTVGCILRSRFSISIFSDVMDFIKSLSLHRLIIISDNTLGRPWICLSQASNRSIMKGYIYMWNLSDADYLCWAASAEQGVTARIWGLSGNVQPRGTLILVHWYHPQTIIILYTHFC